MTDKSTLELERDAERVRESIADTAEHLRDKMSPGQLMDEVVTYFKDGDASQLVDNLKHQVRDNPLALAFIGGGLAWLMMGTGTGSSRPSGNASLHRPASGPRPTTGVASSAGTRTIASTGQSGPSTSSLSGDDHKGIGQKAGDAASKATSAASDAMSKVGDTAERALHGASDRMHDATDSVAETAARLRESGGELAGRARSTFLDALEREPLVIGALGVAVGAAIGALLPSTRVEQDYMGAASASVRHQADDMVKDGIDKAKHVAEDVYSAARDEADKQDLLPGDRPLADKVGDVLKAAGAKAEESVESALLDEKQTEPAVSQSEQRLSKGRET